MTSRTHSHPFNTAPPGPTNTHVKRKYIDIADEGIQTLLMISNKLNKETGEVEISQNDLSDALESIARSRAVKILRTGEGSSVSVTNPKTTEPLKFVQAGRLSLMQVCSLLSVDYEPAGREYIWSVPGDDADSTTFHTACIGETVYLLLHRVPFRPDRTEPFARTIIDLILWDHLKLFCENNAGKTPLFPMKIVTEHSLQAVSTDGQTVVSGRADYVVGYSTDDPRLSSVFIAVEAKGDDTFSSSVGQAVSYQVALQQQRVSAGKPNITVYGISASSNMFQFFRLDPQRKLNRSRVYLLPEDEGWVLLFIDNIITAAATASPHTTPHKSRYYQHPAAFEKHVERPLFNFPQSEVEQEYDPTTDELYSVVIRDGKVVLELVEDA